MSPCARLCPHPDTHTFSCSHSYSDKHTHATSCLNSLSHFYKHAQSIRHAHIRSHRSSHAYWRMYSGSWVVWVAVWWCLLTGVSAQFGLVSPKVSFLRASQEGMFTGGIASRLTQLGEGPPLPFPRRSASTRESEIAAIFRGVANGAPTQGPNTTTAPPTTTTMATTTTTTATSTTTTTTITTAASLTYSGQLRPFTSEYDRDEPRGVELVRLRQNQAPAATTTDGVHSGAVSYILHDDINTNNTSAPSLLPGGKDVVVMTEGDKRNISRVRELLGVAWWVHVYVSAGLLALLAAAALCCLARAASTLLLLPRPHYLIIYTMVFLGASLRSLYLFHDPYGVEGRLPQLVADGVEEASWPCMIAALAVLVVVVGRGMRRSLPPRPYTPVVLGLLTGLQVLVSAACHTAAYLLPQYALPLQVVARAVTATWGGGVGAAGVWVAWRVEAGGGREHGQLLGRATHWPGRPYSHCGLQYGARLALVASVAQILLALLQLYILVSPIESSNHVWVWWVRVSLARALELVLGVGVITGSCLLGRGRPPHHPHHDHTIFSVFTSCGRDGRGAEVFPASSEKQHILGSFSLRPGGEQPQQGVKRPPSEWSSSPPPDKSATLHSVTSDFQLLWNRERTQSAGGYRPSSMLVNDSGFVRFRTQVDPAQAMDHVYHKSSRNLHCHVSPPASYPVTTPSYSSQTLPPSRYYCIPVPTVASSPERSPSRHPLRAKARGRRPGMRGGSQFPRSLHPASPSRHHLTLPATPAARYELQTSVDDYEVASYYQHPGSISSSSTNMYCTPHRASPATLRPGMQVPGVHCRHPLRDLPKISQPGGEGHSNTLDPSTCSSLSEIHVDYLTDVSSSNDAVNHGSLPLHPCHLPPNPRPYHTLLTLPLTPAHGTRAGGREEKVGSPTEAPQQPDITPDSAVVLDYSTSAEEDGDQQEEEQQQQQQPSAELMQISSCSPQSEGGSRGIPGGGGRAGLLLSKLVGSSMSLTCYGYSPLDVEDTSSPSQEAPATTKSPAQATETTAGVISKKGGTESTTTGAKDVEICSLAAVDNLHDTPEVFNTAVVSPTQLQPAVDIVTAL